MQIQMRLLIGLLCIGDSINFYEIKDDRSSMQTKLLKKKCPQIPTTTKSQDSTLTKKRQLFQVGSKHREREFFNKDLKIAFCQIPFIQISIRRLINYTWNYITFIITFLIYSD